MYFSFYLDDGLNMNKILKDFQEDLSKKKIGSLS